MAPLKKNALPGEVFGLTRVAGIKMNFHKPNFLDLV
jgi:hypothetical protein